MDKDRLKTVAGSRIAAELGIGFPLTSTQLTVEKREAFCGRCEDYALLGDQVSAADYNNWGCCLAWAAPEGQPDSEPFTTALGDAKKKFEAGLAVAHSDKIKKVLEGNKKVIEDVLEGNGDDDDDGPNLPDWLDVMAEVDEEAWEAEDDEPWGDL